MSALDQVRDTFFQECEDLLTVLEEGLLAIGGVVADDETIHSVFRAVHSIKGGAGAFGFDDLVRFAHEFESVLDAVRNGALDVDDKIIGVLLISCDMLGDLVAAARGDTQTQPAGVDDLMAEFVKLLPASGDTPDAAGSDEDLPEFAPVVLSLDLGAGAPAEAEAEALTTTYSIQFHPSGALYRNGNETALILRALSKLGDMEVTCDISKVPLLAALDPEKAYLSWKIRLVTSETETAVRDVFEFVEGVCELEITAETAASDPAPEAVPPESTEVTADTPPATEIPEQKRADTELSETGGSKMPDQATPVGDDAGKTKLAERGVAAAPRGTAATVRVEVGRIDRLINLVGELVMNQAMLAQSVTETEISSASELATGLDELKQLSRGIQDSVMAIRAQPVKSLFQRMSRIVRESSAATGKKVRLEISGEMTEVDKTVIEKLADPLTHMIRNAVDHGLEVAEVRAEAGKDETGTIWLSAAHRSGRVVIEVRDDGGGIDRERVQQTAVDKGLIGEDEKLSSDEIDALLFRPGFSTVGKVSKLSGRGVGMDVVRSAIRALSGRISINSRPGEGSTFSVSLPLTLAVLDGMVVEVAQQMLVIPITAIIEMLRPEAGNLHSMSYDSNVIFVRDAYVPVVDIGYVLGYRDRIGETGDRIYLLVETDSGARFAMLVDRIHNQRQVVIKGLDKNLGHIPGIAAATVLGDGRVALILDPNDGVFIGGADAAAAEVNLEATG